MMRSSTLAQRRIGLAGTTALAGLLAAAPVAAQTLPNPGDGQPLVPGSAIITKPDANTLNVQITVPRAIIDWSSFNIGTGQTANFTDAIPPLTSGPPVTVPIAVLNRVIGGEGSGLSPSQLLGTLRSDPNVLVFLVNPEGILFGAGATVSVGSLVASTRDISDNDFLGGTLRFAGNSVGAVEVRSGAQLAANLGARGLVALIGARVETAGAITASGEVAVVAANDTTIRYDSASPLAITIAEGTALSNPIIASNTVTGSSIVFAAATRNDVTAALLDVQATMTATTAYATDQGIVLAAGRTAALAPTIAMPVLTPRGVPSENNGALALRLGGTLGATGAAGSIDVRAKGAISAPVTPATLSADQAVLVTSDGGGIVLGGVTATAGTLTATAGAGDLALASGLSGGVQILRASGMIASAATLRSTGAGLDAEGASLSLGEAVAQTDVLLTATGGALDVTRVAAGQAATLNASGDGAVGSLNAGTDASLFAGGLATLRGGGVVGDDLSVSGADVRLGGGTGVQQAGGDARYTARTGTIASVGGGGLTIRADAVPTPSLPGSIILEAATGVALGGVGLVTGDPAGASNTGDVDVRLPGGGRALTLGTIDARALIGAGSGAGDVTLGATRLTTSLALATPGAVSLASVAIASPGQTLSVAGASVSATGTVSAPAGVAVSGSGPVSLADVSAAAGAATLTSITSALTAGAVTAAGTVTVDAPGLIRTGDVLSSSGTVVFQSSSAPATGAVIAGAVQAAGSLTVARPTALSFASARSVGGAVALSGAGVVGVTGAVTAGTSVAVTGASTSPSGAGVSLGSVAAGNGVATLTATAGGVTVGGGTLATGAVTLDAPGAIDLGDVRSTGDTVVFRSTAVPVTGAITAGAVRARTALSVDRAAGLTFAGAVSETGAVSLTSSGGGVAVDGVTRAGTGVTVDAASVGLQDVTAGAGPVSLTARTGSLSADAVAATGFVFASAGTRLTLDNAAAGERIELYSGSGGIDVAGALSAGTHVSVDAGTSADIGSVTAAGSSASLLRARAGSLTVVGATSVGGALTGQATGDIDMGSVRSTAGAVTLASSAGAVDAFSVDGASSVDVSGEDALTLGAVVAREAGASLVSRDGDIAVGSATTGTTLFADAAESLSVGSASVGGGAILLGGEVALGPITAATVSVTARSGGVTIGQVSAGGDVGVSATGAAVLAGPIGAGGNLTVSGAGVTLGSAGTPVTQVAAGSIDVTGTGGAIAGLSGLTLRSDTGGVGGRDVTLRSTGGIAFGANTLIAGGGDRQSAVRLAAAPGASIVLDAVEVRTIASHGGAATLAYDGPVRIGRIATRDTLGIALTGAGDPLSVGTVEVRAGDLSLAAPGALATDALSVRAGATTLAGASVTSGDIATRSLSATASTGAVALTTVDASAGGVAVVGGSDVRLIRATATGAIALTSTGGDVAGPGANAAALTAGGTVTVRANATDGVRGVVLLDAVSGAGGVDLAGRTITAERVQSAGGVTVTTRRDVAGITDQRVTIGTVDAAGSIAVATGNAAAVSNGAVALDRATSSGGNLTIATLGGGLAARSGSARTVLAAPAGAVSLDIGGAAVLDTVTGRAVTIAAAGLDAAAAAASAGGLIATAATDLRLGTGQASGDARLAAGRLLSANALTVGGGLTLNGATVDVRTISAGALTATGGAGGLTIDTATVAGNAGVQSGAGIILGTLDANGVGAQAAGPLTATRVAARGGDAILSAGGDLRLGSASVSGVVGLTSGGSSVVTGAVIAGGAYRVDAASVALGTPGATVRQAGGEIALVARTGPITVQGSTTLAGARAVELTANGTGGALALAPDTVVTSGTGDVTLATRGVAALGTVSAPAGAIRLSAADAALTRAVSAQSVALTNVATTGVTRLGDAGVGNEAEFGAGATRFDLTNAEIGLVAAPVVTIASGTRDAVVGAVALGANTGSTRFAIAADTRIDMLGRFAAAGSPATRTIAIGNDASTAARTAVLRLAATPGEGGRLLVGDAVLALSAERIGGGFDRDFLDAIGYRNAPGLRVEQVTREYVARPTSTLYNASAFGAPPYTDLVLVRAGELRLTYGRYALFQNTGRPGEQQGVVVGRNLQLAAPGSSANTFALFGTIDGISSAAAALLGPDRLATDAGVSQVSSRINGCVIGSGAGCLNTSIAQPTLNLFDTSRAEIVRTADDLSLPFDPLIGTNNEALYLDPVADPAPKCEGDQPCPVTR